MIILLDMDEVLADFVGGSCELFGVRRSEVEQNWMPGDWGVEEPISKTLGLPETMSEDLFWEKVRGNSLFWYNLKPLPWMRALISLVEEFTDEWHIVSAPTQCATCRTQKERWLRRYFGDDFDRFVLTKYKYLFSKDNAILIDDRDKNVETFVANGGGGGLVFPAIHNTMHSRRADPLEHVRQGLDFFFNFYRDKEGWTKPGETERKIRIKLPIVTNPIGVIHARGV